MLPSQLYSLQESNRNLVRRFLIDRIMYIQLVRKCNVPRLEDITVSAAAQWAANGNERGSCVGPRKLLPFLVRKKSPKRTSNPLSFGPQIAAMLDKGQHVIFPKKEASPEFIA